MKTSFYTLLLAALFTACTGNEGQKEQDKTTLPSTTIRLLEGDMPDPSVVRVNDTYYMVHSSFIYNPELIVYSSKNLADWTPCSAALPEYNGDIWAPDLCVYNNRFYIYFPTRNEKGEKTNMVTWADSPEGPWSTPIDLKVGGIDPEHVTDDEGNRYLLLSSGDLHPLSKDGLSITAKPTIIYKGWEIPEEWDIESFSLEGLNVKKIGEWYYLLAAEGGTAGPPTGHMVIQARSKKIQGPWENAPQNPLLRTLSPEETWWSQGHGSIVDTPDGKLLLFFHGYEKGFLTLGRQTLVREVTIGKDKWLHLTNQPAPLPTPQRPKQRHIKDFVWQAAGENFSTRFHVSPEQITLQGKGNSPQDASPLLARAGDHSYKIEACLELNNEKASAGLVMYYNKDMHFGLGFRPGELLRYRRGAVHRNQPKVEIKFKDGKCRLWIRLQNVNNIISGWYSSDGKTWHKYPWGFDMQGYHHNTLGEFLSVRPGIYAGGEGEVYVTDFTYQAL